MSQEKNWGNGELSNALVRSWDCVICPPGGFESTKNVHTLRPRNTTWKVFFIHSSGLAAEICTLTIMTILNTEHCEINIWLQKVWPPKTIAPWLGNCVSGESEAAQAHPVLCSPPVNSCWRGSLPTEAWVLWFCHCAVLFRPYCRAWHIALNYPGLR